MAQRESSPNQTIYEKQVHGEHREPPWTPRGVLSVSIVLVVRLSLTWKQMQRSKLNGSLFLFYFYRIANSYQPFTMIQEVLSKTDLVVLLPVGRQCSQRFFPHLPGLLVNGGNYATCTWLHGIKINFIDRELCKC